MPSKQRLLFSLVVAACWLSLGTSSLAQDEARSQEPGNHEQGQLDTIAGQNRQVMPQHDLLGQCLQGRRIPKEMVEETLRQEMNVVTVNSPHPVDQELLIYLMAYLKIMGLKFNRPVFIHNNGEQGPRLVSAKNEKDGLHLFFTKNAAAEVFTKKLGEKYDEHFRRTGQEPRRLTVDFNNTLFEQLTGLVSTRQYLGDVMKNQFGMEVTAKPGTADAGLSREMTGEELTMVLKQWLDLPREVLNRMAVERIVRMKAGVQSGNTAADYRKKEKTIRLYDLAFQNGPVMGEGTILHELAHALWETMTPTERGAFSKLSWDKTASGLPTERPGISNFVSDYASKSPGEDFAETFSTFVNRNEWLKKRAPDKHAYLKRTFFKNTDYSTRANPRAQVHLDSENPDVTPPKFAHALKNSIELTVKPGAVKEAIVLGCRVNEVFDDISGVREISLLLRDPNKGKAECYVFLRNGECIDPKKGIYAVDTALSATDYPPETKLRVERVGLSDHAGNETTIAASGPEVAIAGTAKRRNRPATHPLESRLKDIKITPTPKVNGQEPGFEVSFPMEYTPDLETVVLVWDYPGTKFGMRHQFQPGKLGLNAGSPLKVQVHFPKQAQPGTAALNHIGLYYGKTPELEKGYYHINLRHTPDHLKMSVAPTGTVTETPKMDLNRLDLKVARRPKGLKNGQGGDTSVIITVPVEGLDPDKTKTDAYIRVRSPSGREILRTTGDSEGKVITENGKTKLQFRFDLEPNHEAGKYTLESMEIGKRFPHTDKPGSVEGSSNLGDSFSLTNQEKLLERGITRTFDVE